MKVTIQDTRTSVTVQPRDFKVTVSGARGPQGPPGEAGASEWGDIGGTLSNQPDLQNALDAKVAYTGATQDVNLGEYGAQLGNLEFDNTPTNVPTTAGSVYWNDTDGTLNIVLKGGQTISRVGETQHIRALNNTGAQIARGKVVYVVGAQGQRLTIALADADTEILSKDTIGFTAEAIADGAEGFVIVQGVINNVSTTGMTDGATVYLSQTAGSYTTTPPTDPAHLVILGFIVNGGSGGAGSIYVKVDNGYELEELHNISDSAKTTPVGDDALLLRDSADNNLWKRLTWTNALAGVKSHMDTFKSVAAGYASLDGSGKVPASELPSYVDDVVEVANYAALPGTGETGKIYVTLDTNKCYRWSGSVYVQVAQGVDTLTTTGTSGAATLVGSTLNIPQYQGVLTNPVTGTGTAGQVAYFNGTSAVTGSANLFWDAANGRLGIGTASPGQLLDVNGTTIIKGGLQLNGSAGGSTTISGIYNDGGASYISVVGVQRIYNRIGSNYVMRTESGGTLIMSNTNDAVAPAARLHVRSTGTTSATTALLVQNSGASNILTVRDNGDVFALNGITIGTTNSSTGIYPGGISGQEQLFIRSSVVPNTSNVTDITLTNSQGDFTITTGSRSLVNIQRGFIPTSGTGVYNLLLINPTINQTGGANGITRGLYVNPTLTSAADWRSVEFSNNTGWGLYGSGTANNYLGGSLGIGTTSLTARKLSIGGITVGSGFNYGTIAFPTIQSDVTNYLGFNSEPSTQAASFTLTTLRHFSAIQGTFGLGSSVTTQAGFWANSSLTGATNNYGFYGDIASGTGRWNLYMNGTAANYLAGNTSIGTTTSSGRLTVQGSGTTSATKAFVVNNSTPTAIFEILDNGRINQTIPGAVNNTFFGTNAGSSASLTGVSNSLYGLNSGQSITSGSSNSAIGVNSLQNNSTGYNNSAIGLNAGRNNITGYSNIFFGVQAGQFIADGTTSLTLCNTSVFLGSDTRALADSQSNQIVIGFQAIGNGSNTATLGNTSITATYLRGNINYTDGGNFVFGTTTGTKIGTATTQKLSFWNATPVAQPTTAIAEAAFVENSGGTAVNVDSTFAGYTIQQIAQALKDIGILA